MHAFGQQQFTEFNLYIENGFKNKFINFLNKIVFNIYHY